MLHDVTGFYSKEIFKVDSNHILTCLPVISLDSALQKGEDYYPQDFLKECKYITKKLTRHIDELEKSDNSVDSDEE